MISQNCIKPKIFEKILEFLDIFSSNHFAKIDFTELTDVMVLIEVIFAEASEHLTTFFPLKIK